MVKLDLGSGDGSKTPEGFEMIDVQPYKGAKIVDLTKRWPWKANSVEQAQCHYLLHFLPAMKRVWFYNELYRVLKPNAQCSIQVPHWASARYYTDPRVQWPPITEWSFFMLNAEWRVNQPYMPEGINCDFELGIVHGLHPLIASRNDEYKQHAIMFDKEAAQELIVTLTKRG